MGRTCSKHGKHPVARDEAAYNAAWQIRWGRREGGCGSGELQIGGAFTCDGGGYKVDFEGRGGRGRLGAHVRMLGKTLKFRGTFQWTDCAGVREWSLVIRVARRKWAAAVAFECTTASAKCKD